MKKQKKCWKGYKKKTGTQKLFGKTKNRTASWYEKIKEGAAWTKKEGKNEKVDSTKRAESPMRKKIQEAILRDLQRKLGTSVERLFAQG